MAQHERVALTQARERGAAIRISRSVGDRTRGQPADTAALLRHLQRTAGNAAVNELLRRARPTIGRGAVVVQREDGDEEEARPITTPEELFAALALAVRRRIAALPRELQQLLRTLPWNTQTRLFALSDDRQLQVLDDLDHLYQQQAANANALVTVGGVGAPEPSSTALALSGHGYGAGPELPGSEQGTGLIPSALLAELLAELLGLNPAAPFNLGALFSGSAINLPANLSGPNSGRGRPLLTLPPALGNGGKLDVPTPPSPPIPRGPGSGVLDELSDECFAFLYPGRPAKREARDLNSPGLVAVLRHLQGYSAAEISRLVVSLRDAGVAPGELVAVIGPHAAFLLKHGDHIGEALWATRQGGDPEAIYQFALPYIGDQRLLALARDVLATAPDPVAARREMTFLQGYVGQGERVLRLARDAYAHDPSTAAAEMTALAKYGYDPDLKALAEQMGSKVAEATFKAQESGIAKQKQVALNALEQQLKVAQQKRDDAGKGLSGGNKRQAERKAREEYTATEATITQKKQEVEQQALLDVGLASGQKPVTQAETMDVVAALGGAFSRAEITTLYGTFGAEALKAVTDLFGAATLKALANAFGLEALKGLLDLFGAAMLKGLHDALTLPKLTDLVTVFDRPVLKNVCSALPALKLKDLLDHFSGAELKSTHDALTLPKLVELATPFGGLELKNVCTVVTLPKLKTLCIPFSGSKLKSLHDAANVGVIKIKELADNYQPATLKDLASKTDLTALATLLARADSLLTVQTLLPLAGYEQAPILVQLLPLAHGNRLQGLLESMAKVRWGPNQLLGYLVVNVTANAKDLEDFVGNPLVTSGSRPDVVHPTKPTKTLPSGLVVTNWIRPATLTYQDLEILLALNRAKFVYINTFKTTTEKEAGGDTEEYEIYFSNAAGVWDTTCYWVLHVHRSKGSSKNASPIAKHLKHWGERTFKEAERILVSDAIVNEARKTRS